MLSPFNQPECVVDSSSPRAPPSRGGFLFQGGKPPLSTVMNPKVFEGGAITPVDRRPGGPAGYPSLADSRHPCLEYPCVAATNKCLARSNKSRRGGKATKGQKGRYPHGLTSRAPMAAPDVTHPLPGHENGYPL
jgi:hypothetical protein